MLEQGTVTEIIESAAPKIFTVGSRTYSSEPLNNLPLPIESRYPTVPLLSLDSFVDFIKARTEKDAFVVCAPDVVELVSEPLGEARHRDCFAKVTPNVRAFTFEQYMNLEDFRIALLTQFVETPARAQILAFVAKITDQNVRTSEDDGTSQTVTIKAGIASYGESQVPSPVKLSPIRTFQEVEQPEGQFLLRMQQVKDALPKVGLFELHTNWKRGAALNVKAYLDSKSIGLPIFA
jgi:hypothetical protein